MRLTKSVRAARMACRECGVPIDLDWARCPYCSVEQPIQSWRRVRPAVVMAVAMIGACLLVLGVRSYGLSAPPDPLPRSSPVAPR